MFGGVKPFPVCEKRVVVKMMCWRHKSSKDKAFALISGFCITGEKHVCGFLFQGISTHQKANKKEERRSNYSSIKTSFIMKAAGLQKGAADDCRRVTSAQSDRAAVRSSAGRGRRCLDAHTRRA